MLNLIGAIGDACMCAIVMTIWLRAPVTAPAGSRTVYLAIAALFAVLAAEKFFNLDSQLQTYLRQFAKIHGDYDRRRNIQAPLVFAITMSVYWVCRLIFIRYNLYPSVVRCAFLALLLGAFDIVRMISLHAVDAVLFASIGPLHVNHIIEGILTGSILLCVLPLLLDRPPPVAPHVHRRRR